MYVSIEGSIYIEGGSPFAIMLVSSKGTVVVETTGINAGSSYKLNLETSVDYKEEGPFYLVVRQSDGSMAVAKWKGDGEEAAIEYSDPIKGDFDIIGLCSDIPVPGAEDASTVVNELSRFRRNFITYASPIGMHCEGSEVSAIHDALEKHGYDVPPAEREGKYFSIGTASAVRKFQADHGLAENGTVDAPTKQALDGSQGSCRIDGTARFDDGRIASGVTLRLYSRVGNAYSLSESVNSDSKGAFAFALKEFELRTEFQIRVAVPPGNEKEVALKTMLLEQPRMSVALTIPVSVRPMSEHARLKADLGSEYSLLKTAQEEENQNDLWYLEKKSGWDVAKLRNAAMAARTVATARGDGGKPLFGSSAEPALYALFTEGLPSDPRRLVAVKKGRVEEILDKALGAGIISQNDVTIGIDGFNKFQNAFGPNYVPENGVSPLAGLFGACDTALETRFTQIAQELALDYINGYGRVTAPGFLGAADKDSYSKTLIIGSLTNNSEQLLNVLLPLVKNVPPTAAVGKLLENYYYRPEKWRYTFDSIPDLVIPSEFKSKSEWAKALAKAFFDKDPTLACAWASKHGKLPSGTSVGTAMVTACGKGYKFGTRTPSEFTDLNVCRADVENIQRLYALASGFISLKTLMTLELGSARAISKFPESTFISKYNEIYTAAAKDMAYENEEISAPPGEAAGIYLLARNIHETTYNLGKQIPLLTSGLSISALQGQSDISSILEKLKVKFSKTKFPNIQNLFGPMDYTDAPEGETVLSPAAYFVDLLRMLDKDDDEWRAFTEHWKLTNTTEYSASYKKPYDELNRRRPDLSNIDLSSENTFTMLPHIDVVNEILECSVANNNTLGSTAAHNTGGTPSEALLVEPQYIEAGAYTKLSTATHPLVLPFDLEQETLRAFMSESGVELKEVFDAFAPADKDSQAEWLGMSRSEYTLLAVTTYNNINWHTLYGYDTVAMANAALATWTAKDLTEKLGITYAELVDLLKLSWYINPEGTAITLALSSVQTPIADTKLRKGGGPLTWEDAVRFVRFVRLWKRLGWSISDVDALLGAFASSTAAAIEGAVVAAKLMNRLGLTRDQLPRILALSGVVPFMAKTGSLYERLFKRPEIIALDSALKTEIPGNMANVWSRSSGRIAAVKAALGMTNDEFGALKDAFGTNTSFTVWHLASHVFMARAMRISVSQMLSLVKMFVCDFYRAEPLSGISACLVFAELVCSLRQAGLSIEAVIALGERATDASWLEGELTLYQEFLDAKKQIDDQSSSIPDGEAREVERARRKRDVLVEALARNLNLPKEASDRMLSLMSTLRADGVRESLYDDFNEFGSAGAQIMDMDGGGIVPLATPAIDAVVVSKMPTKSQIWTLEGYFETPPAGSWTPVLSVPLSLDLVTVTCHIGSLEYRRDAPGAIKLDPGVYSYRIVVGDENKVVAPSSLVDLKFNVQNTVGSASDVTFRRRGAAYRRLAKSAELFHELKLDPAEIAAVIDAGLLPQFLPSAWCTSLWQLERAAHVFQWRDALSSATLLSTGFNSVMQTAQLDQRFAQVDFEKRLGIPKATLQAWSTKSTQPSATSTRHAFRCLHDDKSWEGFGKRVFDRLRGRRRDALVAYLVKAKGYSGPEELFEQLLIDTQMEPVVLTSRLQAAIASVQTFVQRCLLNMEAKKDDGNNVHPSAIDGDQWQWMKRYRIWEAGRKIFLFPENWLEPEFRDGKTHAYKEFESVLQGDVSDEAAKKAFLEYLKKLNEVARLQIASCYLETDDKGAATIHIIGRTRSNPRKYFYRIFRECDLTWTPWEPVRATVEGDQVALTMWEGRLTLIWLTVTVCDGGINFSYSAQPGGPADLEDRTKEIQAKVHWSELLDGVWEPTRSTDAMLIQSIKWYYTETEVVTLATGTGTGNYTHTTERTRTQESEIDTSRIWLETMLGKPSDAGEEMNIRLGISWAAEIRFAGKNSLPNVYRYKCSAEDPYGYCHADPRYYDKVVGHRPGQIVPVTGSVLLDCGPLATPAGVYEAVFPNPLNRKNTSSDNWAGFYAHDYENPIKITAPKHLPPYPVFIQTDKHCFLARPVPEGAESEDTSSG